MKEKIAENINILGSFCGKRDVDALNASSLSEKYEIQQADVMVLFGGSILCGGDVLAQAILDHAAAKYVIVGGAGHTTDTLRAIVHEKYPFLETSNLPEAEIFAAYLKQRYHLEADYLECNSTNCGNNITNLLQLLKQENISFQSIILCQDATMQHRMEAGLRKYTGDSVTIINYAAYAAKVIVKDEELTFETSFPGMWDMERYINLLMGEIPRLSDTPEGYGPQGKNFIAHVDIPGAVLHAFQELKMVYGNKVREANPLFSSI